jgi:hypothetical protein
MGKREKEIKRIRRGKKTGRDGEESERNSKAGPELGRGRERIRRQGKKGYREE